MVTEKMAGLNLKTIISSCVVTFIYNIVIKIDVKLPVAVIIPGLIMCTITVTDFSGNILNENEIEQIVEELRKSVLDREDLRRFRTDDAYLLRYLHACAFDVSVALKRMRGIYDLIRKYPRWFPIDPPLEMNNQIEIKDKAMAFGRKDKNGRPIFVVKAGKIDVDNSNMAEQAQIIELWMETIMDDPQTQATGLCTILDMQDYSWKSLKWLTPSNITVAGKKVNLYPFREVVLHVVNTSAFLNTTIKIIWPFLPDNVKNMYKFHYNNWSSLHEYISPEALPSEYEGTGPDIDFEGAIQYLFDQNAVIGEKLKHHQVIIN